MVRGGSFDYSEVLGAKRKRWLKSDMVALGLTGRVAGIGRKT